MTNKKSPFSSKFIKKIKIQLLEEKEKLEKELNKFTKKNPHVSGDFNATFPDYGDKDDENAAEVAEYITNKPLEESLEKKLARCHQNLGTNRQGRIWHLQILR